MSATLATPRLRAQLTIDDGHEHGVGRRGLPLFLTVDEAAELLRTTRRAVYAMVERRQLPGVVRIRRRVLFRTTALLDWVDQKSAPLPKEGSAMSVNIRQHPRGGWDADIRVLLATGDRHRERRKLDASYSKTTAREWGERRERELLLNGPKIRKEVPTLEAFAPRFIEGYARANRQKPSGIAAKDSILRLHLIPELGSRRLDRITNEQVQQIKRRCTRSHRRRSTTC